MGSVLLESGGGIFWYLQEWGGGGDSDICSKKGGCDICSEWGGV